MEVEVLERRQQKGIKNTSGLRGKINKERCEEVGLETLAASRKRSDVVQAFKILKGIDGVNSKDIFERVTHTAGTRLVTDPWNLKKKKEGAKRSSGQQLWIESLGHT